MAGKYLIVSRKRGTMNALKKTLGADRHRVLTASSGIAAVDIALDQKPDAIFLGVTLTALDGLETARALRSLTPTASIPIIFLAESDEEAQLVRRARVPLTECHAAPFDFRELKSHAAAGWHVRKHVRTALPHKPDNDWVPAILDPLTRTFHRRYLLHRLAYEAKRSERYHTPLAVLMVDVDNLKDINRLHGILTGDSVLIEMGQLILKTVRNSEIAGRNDVQDFMVIAPHTDEDGARIIAERIRKIAAEQHFVLKKLKLNVTVSVGFAATVGSDLSENLALLGRAEGALTRAKRGGKNRVEAG
jgi:two-component system, cell cycle response regulator